MSSNRTAKKVTIGLVSFALVTLVTLASAFLVVTLEKRGEENKGEIRVGTIESSSLTLKDVSFSQTRFCFEPKEGDYSGRVRCNSKKAEVLSSTLSFRYTNASSVRGFQLILFLPEGLKEAARKNYLLLPEAASKEEGATIPAEKPYISDYVVDGEVSSSEKRFAYPISFSWGSFFHEMNPGEYYDEDEAGKRVSDEEMEATLKDFYSLVEVSRKTEEGKEASLTLDIHPVLYE